MKKKPSAFDAMVGELMTDAAGGQLLEDSMSFDMGKIRKVPMRYRIIALGFVRHFSLEELNRRLQEEGFAKLYARSLWEASLIYAFSNGLSYEEWRKLEKDCEAFREKHRPESPFFRGSSIDMAELAAYVEAGSETVTKGLETRHLTREVEQVLIKTPRGEDAFPEFLRINADVFSPVREKTRYYFCKYLYRMLTARIDRYTKALAQGDEEEAEDAFASLVVFKGISALRRKKHTPREAEQLLSNAAVSCGEIFDAFNCFYFEYASLDWMQVLLEYYGNVAALPVSARKTLADHLRRYAPELYTSSDDDRVLADLEERMEENEKELDRIYSLDGTGRGYQRNRTGENTVRKYIRGQLDPDRTTLICFLLFFAQEAGLEAEEEISADRLCEILTECGFPALRRKDAFDCFVLDYLASQDPAGFLMEEVTSCALAEENFYLYRVYQSSTSYSEEFEKLL